jgi:predicted RecA/RadA family phage recombinase
MTQPTQTLNQFGQKPLKGTVAAIPTPTTLSVQVSPSSSETIYAGDMVRLVGGTSPTILVDLCTVVSDQMIGFVIRNPKKASYVAGDALEIAMENSVILLEAYGTINRGNKVEWYPTGKQVKQNAGVNSAVGTALDVAAATGDLIRVLLATTDAYSSSSSSCSSSSSSCRSSSSSSSAGA